jgi:hypothetical protein
MTDRVGTFLRYVDIDFTPDRLTLVRQASDICAVYEGQGAPMSLRQLYYQFVSKNLLPNHKGSYDKLKSAVSDGRMAGLISWTAIEDRGRNLMGLGSNESPEEAMKVMLSGYRIDKWANQPWRPEVWVEKEALIDVVGVICNKLEVDFFACKGYNSQSEQWRAGQRFASYVRKGQRPIVFHLGDHDPSGLDMTRDNRGRLELFAGVPVQVVRLALNMNQIEQYTPPPNYAKMSDSRYDDYRRKFGEESWELDALEPSVIQELIHGAVSQLRDQTLWDEMVALETEDKMRIEMMIGESGIT